ncbi:hypothetical protein CH373_04285 [Leptospira perolatii]|uniref:DUF1145 domain-containing protein n=1 Tax=Leptospira perolatii TaxID=2023191 RepID=A0A2M9ZQV3_9LEPT|nr:hypothetical protein [Leptospira perolatii]PJZ69058.1 hypothetical protein CH360_13045 [Leptospira perolatii]PJZ74456.1 hypothetical protein CH373_04285 [Leptospira perolatii]
MNSLIIISKAITASFWVLWAGLITGVYSLFPEYDSWIILFGWVIFFAHIIETGIYFYRAPKRGGAKISDAIQVFVFGVFHLIPVSFQEK